MARVSTALGTQNGSVTALPSAYLDWATGQRVAISGVNAQSTPATADTLYLIKSTVDCFISVGASPTASVSAAGSWPLVAGETFSVPVRNGHRIGAITTGASGALYVMAAAI